MTDNCSSVIHNHYYCGSGCSNSDGETDGTVPASFAQFPWLGSNSPVVFSVSPNASTGPSFTQSPFANNKPNSSLLSYSALNSLPRKTNLIDIAFVKTNNANYTGSIELTVIVFDFQDNIVRTISAVPVDFVATSIDQWTDVPLVATASDLIIKPNEGVAAQLRFSNSPASNVSFRYYVAGTGQFI